MNLSQPNNNLGATFLKLTELIKTLRSENGCPWDRKQTLKSFHPYVLEEYHELVHAINELDSNEMVEEAGDLIFLTIFLSCMIEEAGYGTLSEMLIGVHEKMTRRHPHVFGDISVSSDKEVIENWSRIKASEEKIRLRNSVLDGVPKSLPALSRAHKLSSRAARVGFDWPNVTDLASKIEEELNEFKHAIENNEMDGVREELGDLLFVLVNLGRHLGIDPEAALNETSDKFERRFRHIEGRLESKNKSWLETEITEMDRYWDEAKILETTSQDWPSKSN
ncbi:MAG: nucleoside triphosphate pyrophosphohydrolase [Deltaproteobacteria bacterium]|nr:nucleoside triphosphate pyrophosphohydrolase [Deltaproteobacteria bacterium]